MSAERLEHVGQLRAPWSPDQVEALNDYQQRGEMHPFTCACNSSLILTATPAGWVCPVSCGYTQDWAWAWMAEPQKEDDDLDAPLTPEEEARMARREPVEDALLAAEAAAAQAGEAGLGKCLACLGVLWDLGAIEYAGRALERVREGAMQAVREAEIEPDHRIRAKAEAWDALTEHAAHAGAELNTPEVAEELRLLREWESAYRADMGAPCDEEWGATARAWDALRAFRERTGT